MDLYANEFETFRRVTLPLVAPGIAAAALLAFSLSFDDFIITNFNNLSAIVFNSFAGLGLKAAGFLIGRDIGEAGKRLEAIRHFGNGIPQQRKVRTPERELVFRFALPPAGAHILHGREID